MQADLLPTKHPALRALMDRLGRDMGSRTFILTDSADEDHMAQVIAKADDLAVRAYLALKLRAGSDGNLEPIPGRYFCDCESFTSDDAIPRFVQSADDVSYAELRAAIRAHFGLE